MVKILHDLKDPRLWYLRYIPYFGSCRILAINRMKKVNLWFPMIPEKWDKGSMGVIPSLGWLSTALQLKHLNRKLRPCMSCKLHAKAYTPNPAPCHPSEAPSRGSSWYRNSRCTCSWKRAHKRSNKPHPAP